MSTVGQQFTLNLPHRTARGADDFFVSSCNEIAVDFIDRWPNWPQSVLYLHGPKGAGKSHLASVWQKVSGAECILARDLTDDVVPALVATGHIVVEDVENILKPSALFHLINLAREEGRHILLTAHRPAGHLKISLPDLMSRLKAAHLVKLEEPDDQLMKALFLKLFADRQLNVKPEVIEYLTRRLARSYEAIAEAVDALDELALSSRRGITVPLAKEWIETSK